MLQVAPSHAPMLTTDRWTVLVIEPDPVMRDLFTRILRKQDLEVLSAPDAQTAMTIAQSHDEGIDLVVSEVIIPKGDGVELTRRIARHHPTARMLLLTDYLESPHIASSLQTSGLTYLAKPFSQQALLERVHGALQPPALRLIHASSDQSPPSRHVPVF